MIAKSRLCDEKNIFSAIRFGNVMASRGSVIPLFISQIKSGQPITITDPNMTRFIMNLDESVELVKFTFENAKGGEIFVMKTPAATVLTIAKYLLKLFKADNEIKIIGTRHGEKLYETLLTREEMQIAEDMGKYFKIPADNRNLNYEQYFTEGVVHTSSSKDYHSHNVERLDIDDLIPKLLKVDFIKKELLNHE